MNAPERITLHIDESGRWSVSTDKPIDDPDYPGRDAEYIRTDLYEHIEISASGWAEEYNTLDNQFEDQKILNVELLKENARLRAQLKQRNAALNTVTSPLAGMHCADLIEEIVSLRAAIGRRLNFDQFHYDMCQDLGCEDCFEYVALRAATEGEK